MVIWLIVIGLLFSFDLCLQLSIAATFIDHPLFESNTQVGEKVSAAVVVVVKDEEKNLPNLFDSLRKQNFSKLKFVLIDDHSTDASLAIMRDVQLVDERFEVHEAGVFTGKKSALHYVIMQRNEDYMLLTDADCVMHNDSWVKHSLMAMQRNKADLGVGSGLLYEGKNWWTRWQARQNLRMHQLFHAAIHWNYPYMAVGRSLVLKTDAFKNVNGMLQHLDLPGGTDDLLLQTFVRNRKTVISIPEATTWSHPAKTFKGLIAQRNRHLSAGFRYPALANALVFTYEILAITLLVGVLITFFISSSIPVSLSVLVLYVLCSFLHDINSVSFLRKATGNDVTNNLWLGNAWVSTINALTSMLALCVKPAQWTKRR